MLSRHWGVFTEGVCLIRICVVGVRRAQKVAKNEVGADVALKQADFWGQVQRAAGRQFSAVVNDDVGVVHQFFLQIKRRSVQPRNPGIDEKSPHSLVNAQQIQGVGDDLDLLPLAQFAQSGGLVLAVVQNANQGSDDLGG